MSSDLRVLSAACDLAVVRALELIGKRIVRLDRSRFGTMARTGHPWHEAHTIWTPDDALVNAALSGAWSILPRLVNEHGCCSVADVELQHLLDKYVRDLVSSHQAHRFTALEERLHDLVP